MGSTVFAVKGLSWWRDVVPPDIPQIPPPPYPAVGMVYTATPAYPGLPSPASVQQHTQAGGTLWGAQGGKGEKHRRAKEGIGEEERRLQEREAPIMGRAARVAEEWTEGQGMPRGGEAQAVEELQRAWADLRKRPERQETAELEGGRHRELAQESGRSDGCHPLQPFRQPAIPPEQQREMQERAWRQIRGEAARLAERDNEGGGKVAQGAGGGGGGGPRGAQGPPALGRGHPLHGCPGAVGVREEGQRGGRGGLGK